MSHQYFYSPARTNVGARRSSKTLIVLLWCLSSTAFSFSCTAAHKTSKTSLGSTTAAANGVADQQWTRHARTKADDGRAMRRKQLLKSRKRRREAAKRIVREPHQLAEVVDSSPPSPLTAAWAERYTSVDSLRATFGSNRNRFWGDLDASSTRRLYKALLPTALLQLVHAGVYEPRQLAPLAYRARVAAKLYARERSVVPVRAAANCLDGWRQFHKYGKFQRHGMTYDQVWAKYRNAILADCHEQYHYQQQLEETFLKQKNPRWRLGSRSTQTRNHSAVYEPLDYWGLTEEDVTARICLEILERSCATNEMVDAMVLTGATNDKISQLVDLDAISATIEDDVRRLLLPQTSRRQRQRLERELQWTSLRDEEAEQGESHPVLSLQRYRTLRLVVRARRRAWRRKKTSPLSVVDCYVPTVDAEEEDVGGRWRNREFWRFRRNQEESRSMLAK